jgi:hypothetical protein
MTLYEQVASAILGNKEARRLERRASERTPVVTRSRRDVYIPILSEFQGNSAFLCLQIGAAE